MIDPHALAPAPEAASQIASAVRQAASCAFDGVTVLALVIPARDGYRAIARRLGRSLRVGRKVEA